MSPIVSSSLTRWVVWVVVCGYRKFQMNEMGDICTCRWEKLNDEYRSVRELCISLMFVSYVKWQFVNLKDFSWHPFLLPQLASGVLQNVPFCSGERDLQCHSLLAAATPSPRQLCLASSHPLPSRLLIQKVRFVDKNCCIFLVPGPTSTRYTETAPFGFSRFQPTVLHVKGTNCLYRTKPRLVHF